jgi:hypothetical protein
MLSSELFLLAFPLLRALGVQRGTVACCLWCAHAYPPHTRVLTLWDWGGPGAVTGLYLLPTGVSCRPSGHQQQ